MRNQHTIPIAGGNTGKKLTALVALKIVFRRDQDIGAGIRAQELGGKLVKHVVWHHIHRFAGLAQAAKLHTGTDAGQCFASPDYMGKQGV